MGASTSRTGDLKQRIRQLLLLQEP